MRTDLGTVMPWRYTGVAGVRRGLSDGVGVTWLIVAVVVSEGVWGFVPKPDLDTAKPTL